MFDLQEMRQALPRNLQGNITQSMVDAINQIITDPIEAEAYKNNAITYATVLSQGKYRMTDYLNAVRFVTYKMGGMTNQEAYIRTWPDRHARFVALGKDDKYISAAVSMYANSKLVTSILSQAIVPLRLVNQHHRQFAINRLVDVLNDPKAMNKDTINAADTLLKHLADPEETTNSLNISVELEGAESIVNQLEESLNRLAQSAQARIIEGERTQVIVNTPMVELKEDE